MNTGDSFIILLSALAIITGVIFIIKTIREKKKKAVFLSRKKAQIKQAAKVVTSNGLKVYHFKESGCIPAFRCAALNDSNAQRKYKNFIKEVNASINKGLNSVWFTDIDNKRKLKTIKNV